MLTVFVCFARDDTLFELRRNFRIAPCRNAKYFYEGAHGSLMLLFCCCTLEFVKLYNLTIFVLLLCCTILLYYFVVLFCCTIFTLNRYLNHTLQKQTNFP